MTRYTPHDPMVLDPEHTVVTTPFLLDVLDSALIESIQSGNIEAAYGMLDLSVNLAQTLEGNTLTEEEGKVLLSKVKRAMEKGNISTAKQHMVEFALR
ncbi:MAG: hypothetical protein PHY87_07170 [Sphaerochaeta sp.]|jgi:hypothetical protein|uniref:hypothetical protein n=1 Tax=Sphaerochaeta sp. TaxID=1972642 RepID=UPI002974475D|nr:hypothetical protein [uncultured Sphaerochaeta sp.]MDD3929560.1 hypothetical protein [Sphaerochaeta sp.]NBK25195.1 hypothetical protein [Spirochaetia bacterium]